MRLGPVRAFEAADGVGNVGGRLGAEAEGEGDATKRIGGWGGSCATGQALRRYRARGRGTARGSPPRPSGPSCRRSDSSGFGRALLEVGQRLGERRAAGRIVAAVEPELGAGLEQRRQRAADRGAACAPASRTVIARARSRARSIPRSASVSAAATAVPALTIWWRPTSAGSGRSSSRSSRLEDEPAALLEGVVVLAPQRRAARPTARAARRMTSSASCSCRETTPATPGFRMPAFSPAILASVSPSLSAWSIETGVMTSAPGAR